MSNDLTTLILTSLVAATGGGATGVLAYLKWFADNKRAAQTFDEAELAKYRKGYDDMERQVSALTLALIPSPFPEWKKDSRRRYVFVSPSYELGVLVPLGLSGSDVLGKTDSEVFSDYPKFAAMLEEIDDESQRGADHLAVRHGIFFPRNPRQMMVIKEIAQNVRRETFYVGRAYPDSIIVEGEMASIRTSPGPLADKLP